MDHALASLIRPARQQLGVPQELTQRALWLPTIVSVIPSSDLFTEVERSVLDYIWQARYYGSGTPSPSDTGSWVPSELLLLS